MGLRKPSKKDIKSGNVVDIYNRTGIREGRAELIRRQPSKFIQDGLPYIRYDRDIVEDTEKVIIQHSKSKWHVIDEAMQVLLTCKTKTEAIGYAADRELKVVDNFGGRSYIWSYERWVVSWVSHSRLRVGDRSTVEVNYFWKLAKTAASLYDNEIQPQETSIRLMFLELKGTIVKEDGDICCITDLHKVWRSFKKPETIIFNHDPIKVKELFDIHNVKIRIAGFIDPKQMSFEEGILTYLEEHSWEDFLILTGDYDSKFSPELQARTIRSNPAEGLQWKKQTK